MMQKFSEYLAALEIKYETKIKRLHSDNGGEQVAMEGFSLSKGIEISRSVRNRPNRNEIAEIMNQTIT